MAPLRMTKEQKLGELLKELHENAGKNPDGNPDEIVEAFMKFANEYRSLRTEDNDIRVFYATRSLLGSFLRFGKQKQHDILTRLYDRARNKEMYEWLTPVYNPIQFEYSRVVKGR